MFIRNLKPEFSVIFFFTSQSTINLTKVKRSLSKEYHYEGKVIFVIYFKNEEENYMCQSWKF